MKSKILELLKQKQTDYVSGEQISEAVGISRSAVWKHIKSLRKDGYTIESHSRVGYKLTATPDKLYPEEICSQLGTEVIGSGIVHLDITDSTNNVAKELASSGAPEGVVVIAEEQSHGRGRLGRTWISPPGKGICVSIILRPDISPIDAPKLTLLAAVALARTFNSYPGVEPGIKWPNDILIKGKKISGVLTEMNAELERVNFIVLGIGINVNTKIEELPEALMPIATSLSIETKREYSRREVLVNLLKNLEELYLPFKNGNYSMMLEEWKKYSVTLNRSVRVVSQKEVIQGKAIDLGEDGAMLVETVEGPVRVLAGEVSFI